MKRVLVVLPNWFGETLFATPFLQALKRGLPQTEILALALPQCEPILQHNPDVARFVPYYEQSGVFGLPLMLRSARQVRPLQADAAIILRKSFSRTLVTKWAGIPMRVGFSHSKVRRLLTHPVAGPPLAHKAASYLPLLTPFGVSAELAPYTCTLTDEEKAGARAWMQPPGLKPSQWVMLHPGANWLHKRWPAERFAALGDRLADAFGVSIAITGGPDDQQLAQAVATNMRQPSWVWAGRQSLRQLAACAQQAALFVSNDTGVLHLAAAVGGKVLGLYGPTSPALTGPLGPADRVHVVSRPDACPQVPCYSADEPLHLGMEALTVDQVFDAADQILSSAAGMSGP